MLEQERGRIFIESGIYTIAMNRWWGTTMYCNSERTALSKGWDIWIFSIKHLHNKLNLLLMIFCENIFIIIVSPCFIDILSRSHLVKGLFKFQSAIFF